MLRRGTGLADEKGMLLIVDIDGTISTDSARRHLRPAADPSCLAHVPRAEIERYMDPALLLDDAPVPGALEWLDTWTPPHLVSGARRWSGTAPGVVFCSARWEHLRTPTRLWLTTHFYAYRNCKLLLRQPYQDCWSSVETKLTNTGEIDAIYTQPVAWLDDDPAMLRAAAGAGFVPLLAPCWPGARNAEAQ